MPPPSAVTWVLGLDEIEGGTGRVLQRKSCRVSELGSAKCSFDRRHVLYSKLRPYLNKVIVPDAAGVGTSELLPLLPDPHRLDREFLAGYLRGPDFVSFATANSRGANLPRVSMEALWSHRVPLPPLAEQRRIVARIRECTERIDEIRFLRSQAAEEVRALLPSALATAFEAVSCEHPAAALGSVLAESRYGTSRKCNAGSRAIPILRIPNILRTGVDFGDLKYCDLDPAELGRLALEPGDLLVVRTNGSTDLVGRCAVFEGFDRAVAFASYLIRLRVDPRRADPRFLAFFLSSTAGRDAIARIRRTSAGQYNVNSENLRAIEVPLPPLDVQRHLAVRLSEVQRVAVALAAEYESRGDEAAELQAAVLRKAFAGEL